MDNKPEIFYQKKAVVNDSRYEYDSINKVVMCFGKGVPSKEELVDGSLRIMKHLDTHPTRGIIYNLVEMKGTFTQGNKFISEQYIPYLNKHGIQYLSVALSTDVFMRFAMNALLKLSNADFEIKIFGSWVEAKKSMEQKLNITVPWNF